MLRYLFTNDLRISSLERVMKDVARMHIDGTVPSASDDKGVNNNAMTLGFYFALMNRSNCSFYAANGNVRRVVLNFIKKFQFPNYRTNKSYQDSMEDGIKLAPMRVILKLLYIIYLNDGLSGYLTKEEIKEFVFYNNDVAKIVNPNLIKVHQDIIDYRHDDILPDGIVPQEERMWKHEERQLREMIKVLLWSGCVKEVEGNKYKIEHSNLSREDKADLFEILTCTDFWQGDSKESYLEYMDMLSPTEEKTKDMIADSNKKNMPRNRIIFGAPGTGKSFLLNKQMKEVLPVNEMGEIIDEYFERVTFHQSYTYSQFVGTYKPKPKTIITHDENGNEFNNEVITYEFVPGPFTRILVKALKLKKEDSNENCMLVIEEINRSKAAAVFGDIFQLLDRKFDGSSVYSIETSEELRKYLGLQLDEDMTKIFIPDNLYLWATMNSSDQGVNPIDTAFKRRWEFEYLGIDSGEYGCEYLNQPIEILDITTTWNKLRKEINLLLRSSSIKLSEDKLMGPFFLSKNAFYGVLDNNEVGEDRKVNSDVFKTAFKSKVLMYLFEDAVKLRKSVLFDSTTFSELCNEFDRIGCLVFKGINLDNIILNEVTYELDEEVTGSQSINKINDVNMAAESNGNY